MKLSLKAKLKWWHFCIYWISKRQIFSFLCFESLKHQSIRVWIQLISSCTCSWFCLTLDLQSLAENWQKLTPPQVWIQILWKTVPLKRKNPKGNLVLETFIENPVDGSVDSPPDVVAVRSHNFQDGHQCQCKKYQYWCKMNININVKNI